MARRTAPEVNAGSMADIAFLLLIFFLVSTTIQTDYGISRRLPPPPDIDDPVATIKEKNLFRVELNHLNELLVEKEPMEIKDLRKATIAFLDNGGGKGEHSCNYCMGKHNSTSSDNPGQAVISLINTRETNYASYIAVQNELVAAYTELRNREALHLYGKIFTQMEEDLKMVSNIEDKNKLKAQIKVIQLMYPEKISEAEPKN